MNGRRLVSLGISLGLIILAGCGTKPTPSASVQTGAANGATDPNATGKGGTGDKGKQPVTLPSQQLAKAQEFFNDKVLPLVKAAPCTNCHADPRVPVQQQGGLNPQSFDKMYALLKDGTGANNNKLFNMMRGLAPHDGGIQCATESAPFCVVLQDWYKAALGEGTLSLGRVNDIAPASGTVSGWAGSASAATTTYKVRFYLDGESGKGTMLGEASANLEANDNNIDGPHGFSFKIPVANIDNKPHVLHAYVLDAAGKESPMSGSPYSYTVFKPKATAAAMQQYTAIFNGCNGACHQFTYESKWPSLVGGFGTAGWSRDNNTLINKFKSGQHGGPGFGAGAVTSSQAWFDLEFPEVPK